MLTPRSLCRVSTKEFQTPLVLTSGVGDRDLCSLLFISSEIGALVLLSTRGQGRTLPCHTLDLPREKSHLHLPLPVRKAGTRALGAGSLLLSAAVAQSSEEQTGTRPSGRGSSTWAPASPSAWESHPCGRVFRSCRMGCRWVTEKPQTIFLASLSRRPKSRVHLFFLRFLQKSTVAFRWVGELQLSTVKKTSKRCFYHPFKKKK